MAASRSAVAHAAVSVVFSLCVIILSWETVEVSAVTRPEDVTALIALARSWSSGEGLNWTGDPCDNLWAGVICTPADNSATVTSLYLADFQILGTLPGAIGGLVNLQNLDLSRNPLNGELPAELGELINLQYLSLQWCNFSGPIPTELSKLTQLTFLALNGNTLSNSIPASFGLLTKVTWLDLSSNQLSGPLPVSSAPGSNGIGLDNMTGVAHFHFNDNLLSGSLPDEIFNPNSLIHLIVDHNRLGPSIPTTAISNAQNLTVLRLDNNQFKGNISGEIGNLGNLLNLNLQNNAFSGLLPDFSSLSNLQLLDASNNQFAAQPFPSWLSKMSNLQSINLAQDSIVGSVDSNVFNISQLQSLNVSLNQVSGSLTFPTESSTSIIWIDVSTNDITGFSNQPQSNGHPLSGVQIMLEGNPLCFNSFLSFKDVSCGPNNLQQLWSAPTNSSCSGVQCKKGRELNHKTCACAYPSHISIILTASTFSNLTDSLANSIENEIATQMTKDSYIDLEASQVVINQGFFTDGERYQLNLLFFPLVGDSLSSQNESEIVMVFNQRRITLSVGPFQVPFGPYTVSRGKGGLSAGAIAGIVIGGLAVILIVVLYAVLQKVRADRAVANHPFASWGAGSNELGDAPKLKGARWFSLAELKLATNDWSKQNEIGRGGYGKVYKGVLKSGEIVAVKRAQEGSMQGAAEFKNEIELLSRVHHRNLVGLVGFCYESGEQALIYEFMSNGTLREHLMDQPSTPLSWQERLDIALGSARGIAYLHDHANPPIIHRDIKTSNILLTEKQGAKVADFGLSKLAPEEGEMRVYSQNVKGTMGYLDPEYYTTFKLTDRSDVYAFGVVLLELLTAKPPISNGKFVVREVRSALDRGGLAELRPLLDPSVQDLPDADLETFLNIALKCVEESSADRDKMANVVKQLEGLGAHSHPNVDAHNLAVGLGSEKQLEQSSDYNDDDVLFPSPPPVPQEADDPNFKYSGNVGHSTTTVRPQ